MLRRLEHILGIVICAMVTTASAAPPGPASSEYLQTVGGNFAVSRGKGIKYVMEFRIMGAMPKEHNLRFVFQHPRKGAEPITAVSSMAEKEGVLHVQSGLIDCAQQSSKLGVTVEVYSESGLENKLGEHVQPMTFSMPPAVLKQFGIPKC